MSLDPSAIPSAVNALYHEIEIVLAGNSKPIDEFNQLNLKIKNVAARITNDGELTTKFEFVRFQATTITNQRGLAKLYWKGLLLGSLNHIRLYCIRKGHEHSYQQLIDAARINNVAVIKQLAAQRIYPDAAIEEWVNTKQILPTNPTRLTALGHACITGAEESVDTLLQCYANPSFNIMGQCESFYPNPNDPISPYVTPTWVALLTCELPHDKKIKILAKLWKNNIDFLQFEGHQLYLNRFFLTLNTSVQNLHAVFSSLKSTSHKIVNFNILTHILQSQNSRKEEYDKQRQPLPTFQTIQWKYHIVKLGAVVMFHDIPLETHSHNSDSKIHANTVIELTHGQRFTLSQGYEYYLNLRAAWLANCGEILPESENEAKDRVKKVSALVDFVVPLVNPLKGIVMEYFVLTAQKFRCMLARQCIGDLLHEEVSNTLPSSPETLKKQAL